LGNNKLKWESGNQSVRYFFMVGQGNKALLSEWNKLTGKRVLLPRIEMTGGNQNERKGSGYKTLVSWDGLNTLLPVLFNLGLSGTPYAFVEATTIENDDELVIRYLQMASLNPVYKYPEDIEENRAQHNTLHHYKMLRYRLMPYLNTLSAQAALKGYPMIRPLLFEFFNDEESRNITGEYMLGKNILVAPVLTKEKRTKSVYLPGRERWYRFSSDRKYRGGNEYNIPVTKDDMPVFVRGGTFLPLADTGTMGKTYSTENLTIRYYVNRKDKSDPYIMYEDAGDDPNALINGKFETLMFLQKRDVRDNLSFMFSSINNGYAGMPESRKIKLEIIGQTGVKKMQFFKNDIELKKKKPGKIKEGFYYDKSRRIWVVEFEWKNEEVIITTKKK